MQRPHSPALYKISADNFPPTGATVRPSADLRDRNKADRQRTEMKDMVWFLNTLFFKIFYHKYRVHDCRKAAVYKCIL